jgi:hypothetical protein
MYSFLRQNTYSIFRIELMLNYKVKAGLTLQMYLDNDQSQMHEASTLLSYFLITLYAYYISSFLITLYASYITET